LLRQEIVVVEMREEMFIVERWEGIVVEMREEIVVVEVTEVYEINRKTKTKKKTSSKCVAVNQYFEYYYQFFFKKTEFQNY
jgi:hypothetical protein